MAIEQVKVNAGDDKRGDNLRGELSLIDSLLREMGEVGEDDESIELPPCGPEDVYLWA